MDKEAISQAILVFQETELPGIRVELSLLQQNNAFPNHILKGRTEEAKKEFTEKVEAIIPRLKPCSTIDEIMDVCREAFTPIRGIGEETIRKYAYHYAYTNNIDPEASCCVCFLTTATRKSLTDFGIVRDGKYVWRELKDFFHNFSYIEIAAYFNLNYKKFVQRFES